MPENKQSLSAFAHLKGDELELKFHTNNVDRSRVEQIALATHWAESSRATLSIKADYNALAFAYARLRRSGETPRFSFSIIHHIC